MEYINQNNGSNAVAELFWSAFAECVPSLYIKNFGIDLKLKYAHLLHQIFLD